MPYIKKSARQFIDNQLSNEGINWTPTNAGDLNFTVSTFIDNYFNEKGLSYATVNEMIGALECAKLELYRRIAAPYEDKKLQENGDAYSIKA